MFLRTKRGVAPLRKPIHWWHSWHVSHSTWFVGFRAGYVRREKVAEKANVGLPVQTPARSWGLCSFARWCSVGGYDGKTLVVAWLGRPSVCSYTVGVAASYYLSHTVSKRSAGGFLCNTTPIDFSKNAAVWKMCIMYNRFSPVGTYRHVGPFCRFWNTFLTAWGKEEGKKQEGKRKKGESSLAGSTRKLPPHFAKLLLALEGKKKHFCFSMSSSHSILQDMRAASVWAPEPASTTLADGCPAVSSNFSFLDTALL